MTRSRRFLTTVAKHPAPENTDLFALIDQLRADHDQRFLDEDLAALLKDRVKWVKAKLRPEHAVDERDQRRRRSR